MTIRVVRDIEECRIHVNIHTPDTQSASQILNQTIKYNESIVSEVRNRLLLAFQLELRRSGGSSKGLSNLA